MSDRGYLTSEEWNAMSKEEQERHIRERQGRKLGVEVSVNTSEMERIIRERDELKRQLEGQTENDFEKRIGKRALEKIKKVAFDVGLGDVNPQSEEEFAKLVRDVNFLRRDEDKGIPKGEVEGGSGRARLTSSGKQQASGSREFESHAEMIAYLRECEHSSDPQIRKEASAVIDELFRKNIEAFQKAGVRVPSYEPEDKSEPIIGKLREMWKAKGDKDGK